MAESLRPVSTAGTEIAGTVDLSILRYGQCWEDADVLLEALDVGPGDVCLSIGSGGDNSLALLTASPARVIAVDVSPAQIASMELRVAGYRKLSHRELLELIGSRPSRRRDELYRRCRILLSSEARAFWDSHPAAIAGGVGGAGKLERYFALWRRRVLPLAHSRETVSRLLEPKTAAERAEFYRAHWDNRRWRALFQVFFSRALLGRFGRDSHLFKYARGRVAHRILARSRHALSVLDPSENPYLQWILTGRHLTALPLALRPESFDVIRENLDRLEWSRTSVEEWLRCNDAQVDRFNLSDIFEYLSPEAYRALLGELCEAGRPGSRLAYWNLMVPRSRPEDAAGLLRPLAGLAQRLHERDRAFFYSAFVVEEVC